MADGTAKNLVAVNHGALNLAQHGQLAEVPPELEWLANLTNPKTRHGAKHGQIPHGEPIPRIYRAR